VLGALIPLVYARPSARLAAVDPTPLGLVVPALQLGLSLTVLASASLLRRGGERAAGPAAPVATGTVYQLTTHGLSLADRAARFERLLRALHASGRVEAASLTSPGTLTGLGPVDVVWSRCGECSWGGLALPVHGFFATHYVVSADTFRAMGLRLVAGRPLTDADRLAAPRVAVVSRSLAQEHFDAKGAVGKLLLMVGHFSTTPYRVVGVVEDQRPAGLGGAVEPPEAVYLSVLQHPADAADLLVRGRDTGRAVSGALAASFTPGSVTSVPVSEAGVLSAEAAPLRWFAGMFDVEGFGLLAIAAIGTFAMMWLWVASLLAELGVRRAVGARRRSVMAYVLWRALLVAVAGAAFGSWLGMMVWDAIGNVVSGLPAWQPAAVVRYGLLLCAAALAGALLPAWRAAHAPPTALLSS